MLIRELEQKSGLDRATIRYYEKEGFITPERQENGYRAYSEEDLQQLMKIRLLRQLGMSLDTIKGLRKGTEDFHAALASRIKSLDEQVMTADRAKDICSALYRENTSYSSLNAAFYLQQLNKPELPPATCESKPALQSSFREPVYRSYHPWRRFLARMTDYQLAGVLIDFFLVVVFRVRPISEFWSNALSFAVPFLMVYVEAAMLWRWGTTPGKWLYGLSVKSENGANLRYADAVAREWKLLKEGYGYGIPLWRIYRLYKSYHNYVDGELNWDCVSEYQYCRWNAKRKCMLAAVILLISGMIVWNSLDIMKPKYRGELSVAQFAENYNHYVEILDESASQTSKLQPDGTYYPAPVKPNISVIVLQKGTPVREDTNFSYTTENGVIRSIHYEEAYTDVDLFSPRSKVCELAIITLLMSQEGTGLGDLSSFAELLSTADYGSDGSLSYDNIEISWDVELENCKKVSAWSYITADDTKPSFAGVTYDIVIHND